MSAHVYIFRKTTTGSLGLLLRPPPSHTRSTNFIHHCPHGAPRSFCVTISPSVRHQKCACCLRFCLFSPGSFLSASHLHFLFPHGRTPTRPCVFSPQVRNRYTAFALLSIDATGILE